MNPNTDDVVRALRQPLITCLEVMMVVTDPVRAWCWRHRYFALSGEFFAGRWCILSVRLIIAIRFLLVPRLFAYQFQLPNRKHGESSGDELAADLEEFFDFCARFRELSGLIPWRPVPIYSRDKKTGSFKIAVLSRGPVCFTYRIFHNAMRITFLSCYEIFLYKILPNCILTLSTLPTF